MQKSYLLFMEQKHFHYCQKRLVIKGAETAQSNDTIIYTGAFQFYKVAKDPDSQNDNTFTCHQIVTRRWSPGLELRFPGVFVYGGVDKTAVYDIDRADIRGKGILVPTTEDQCILVSLPTNFLTEGH